MKKQKPLFSLQTTIAVFACIVVALALLVTDIIINERIAENARINSSEEAIEIARIVANTPLIMEALTGNRDEREIQVFTEKVLSVSEVRFITVMDMNRIRKSHPNPEKIGEYYEEEDANLVFEGQETTSVNKGSLGVSLRAFSPVFAPDGKQVGAVLVGVMMESIQASVDDSRSGIYGGVGVGMLVGVLGSLVLARRIKKILFGLEPFAIAKIFEERSAMLQSVREGILAVDKDSRMTIVNEAAIKLFQQAGISDNPIGQKVDEYVPNTRLQKVLETGEAELDQEQDLNGITILANRVPIIVDGEIVGVIATFRDKTEMRQMAERLTGVSIYAEALRAQTHEFMNKLHVILGMVRLGDYDRLNNYVNQIASRYQAEVGSLVKKIKDPVLAGFIIGKISLAREAGITMTVSEESFLPEPAEPEVVHELITIIGNLINNSLDAVETSTCKCVNIDFSWDSDILTIEVSDTGSGIDEGVKNKIFVQGYSTKGTDRGLGLYLIQRSLERLGGQITVISEVGHGAVFRVILPYWSKEGYFD
ncbi:DcuS/MalK family sensor histidine kinase [Pelosinus sp. UFO1]|uniref:DcuS/MalK family sensor histidine kinase n=1 Tax=Pelosinus sp. UFO1 TaxID=484770 RepID=UPI0004D1ED17|nr:DcuS/MalK family sensor histidine kinase [Pelosinus sp. UFO1]AIF52597.1 signal transduction histidine kinase regulating citrate/malate metabolism [Pelosinus sp. UFO1]